ncbi:MAG: Hsp20/alpha crystallin family protein [Candidatus Peribacteraceae bacterium]|nr:Hsp20/alpha crystallin family protein [Candidatus Peribacteraceae bacterium]
MNPSPFHGIFSFGATQGESFGKMQEDVQAVQMPESMVSSRQHTATIPAVQQRPMGQIAVDIYEQDDYYIIRAPIAGVRLSDLDIEVDEKILTIRGTRRVSDTIPEDQFYLQECFWGEFSRSITMPFSVDPKKVKATFSKDSILKVIIPKEDKVKVIRINEGS